MTDKNAELLPCPFCGGKAEVERYGSQRQSMIVSCEDCGSRMESGDAHGLTLPENYAWNRRAIATAPQDDCVRVPDGWEIKSMKRNGEFLYVVSNDVWKSVAVTGNGDVFERLLYALLAAYHKALAERDAFAKSLDFQKQCSAALGVIVRDKDADRQFFKDKAETAERQLAERCDHCGAKVYSGPPDCPTCGAPTCCPQCCRIDALTRQLAELREKHERLVARLREPTPKMLEEVGPMSNYDMHAAGASPDADHVSWFVAMSTVALRDSEGGE